MKDEKLKNSVHQYYESQELSNSRLNALLEMQELGDETSIANKVTNKNSEYWYYFRTPHFAAAAIFLCVISIFGLFISQGNNHNIELAIAKEIVLNHHKQLPPDLVTTNFVTLNKKMTKLDFSVKASTHLQLAGLDLYGARYCSIQGHIAAQLKYRDKQGNEITLYQTSANKMNKNIKTGEFNLENTQVFTWVEGDSFFGIARNVN